MISHPLRIGLQVVRVLIQVKTVSSRNRLITLKRVLMNGRMNCRWGGISSAGITSTNIEESKDGSSNSNSNDSNANNVLVTCSSMPILGFFNEARIL